MNEEIFKDVPGYEGYYTASNHGNIKNKKGQLIKPHITGSSKYPMVTLKKDGVGKRTTVHRIIAITFIPNPHDLPEVNHKDRNRSNNHSSNLEWVSHRDNVRHAFKNGVKSGSRKAVRLINIKDGKFIDFDSTAEAGRYLKYSSSCGTSVICEAMRLDYKLSGTYKAVRI